MSIRNPNEVTSINRNLSSALQQKLWVMHAVILRDIRSRFFNHGLGFLIVPLFPIGHLIVLLLFYALIGREAVFGEDTILFFATGLIPALLFMYVSRFMSFSLLANKSMMAFPVVKLLDIVLARAFLEIVGIKIAILLFAIILWIAGSNLLPTDPNKAVSAMMAVVILAIGSGIMASVISAIIPGFAFVWSLSMFVIYVTSGAPIYLQNFPKIVVEICAWNPVFHAVDWMRSAYYLGYPEQYLDKQYLLGVGIGALVLGLIMERILRTKLLQS